jgi:hypothetical protein
MSAPVQANIVALPGVRSAWARIQTEEKRAVEVVRESAMQPVVLDDPEARQAIRDQLKEQGFVGPTEEENGIEPKD